MGLAEITLPLKSTVSPSVGLLGLKVNEGCGFGGGVPVTLVVCWVLELVPWILLAPFDRRRRFAHWYSWTWANHFHAISPFWRVQVQGVEKIDKNRSYVIVANHQSSLDILVMFALRRHFKWVAKHSLFFVPIFGWHLFMAGYVPIRRGDRGSREAMMRRCQAQLASGNSIVMFPEGTRNQSRELGPFKRGAFALALQAGVDVIPVVISGTRNCLPRNAWITPAAQRTPVHMVVLDPVSTATCGGDVRALARQVRDTIAQRLAQLEVEPPASEGETVASPG